jgi:hypothetical protein
MGWVGCFSVGWEDVVEADLFTGWYALRKVVSWCDQMCFVLYVCIRFGRVAVFLSTSCNRKLASPKVQS